MATTEQLPSAFQISFSNEKGFEPSTPSQTSPPSQTKLKQSLIRVRNPLELFSLQRSNRLSSVSKQSTPVPIKSSKYDSQHPNSCRNRGNSLNKKGSAAILKNLLVGDNLIKESRKVDIRIWGNLQCQNHLKQISRLDNLISRVQTHMTFYNRLYPKKYY